MKKLLLTSSGFDNKKIEQKFLELINKPVEEIRVLFIPTAAISEAQKAIIPLCRKDLLNAGILDNNIETFNLDRLMTGEEICTYNGIYVCGGDTQHLLDRMNENRFKQNLNNFLESGGVYVGVSAGSIVMAENLENNLSCLNCKLKVHGKTGSLCGPIIERNKQTIELTDNQAILINGNEAVVFE